MHNIDIKDLQPQKICPYAKDMLVNFHNSFEFESISLA